MLSFSILKPGREPAGKKQFSSQRDYDKYLKDLPYVPGQILTYEKSSPDYLLDEVRMNYASVIYVAGYVDELEKVDFDGVDEIPKSYVVTSIYSAPTSPNYTRTDSGKGFRALSKEEYDAVMAHDILSNKIQELRTKFLPSPV